MTYTETYNTSFRCFFDNDGVPHYNNHYFPQFHVADIPRWVDSYLFTHPNCTSMTVKVWFEDMPTDEQNEDND